MSKPEWGTKRTCQGCGVRFYDLNRSQIVCPKCGTESSPEAPAKLRRAAKPVEPMRPVPPIPAPEILVAEAAPSPELAGDEADDDEEEDEVIEDASDLGEDEDDVAEVKEHIENEGGR